MTFFDLIKQCLHAEAVHTEPDIRQIIEKIMKEIKKQWKKEI